MFRQVVLSTTTKPKVSHQHFTPMVYREDNCSKSYLRDAPVPQTSNFASRASVCRSISWDNISDSVTNEKLDWITAAQKARAKRIKSAADKAAAKKRFHDVSSPKRIASVPRLQIDDLDKHKELDPSASSSFIVQKLRLLINAFAERAQKIKSKISRPLSPPVTPSIDEIEVSHLNAANDEDWRRGEKNDVSSWFYLVRCLKQKQIGVFDPQNYFYISWLFLVSIAFLYNSYGILLRTVFPFQTAENLSSFLVVDYLCDAIYAVDIILFKSRLKFTEEGQFVEDPILTRKHYFKSPGFKFDILSLLPLDIFYLLFGPNAFLRSPRLLKIKTFWEFFNRVDVVAKSPYAMRILKTLIYMTFLIHVNASAYYAVSAYEGFDANEWVYNNEGNAYIRCFYFAFRTATSISGKMVKPTNNFEYIFMVNSWLNGVFVFAFLIGQIRDIVATATQNRQHFRQLMNQTIRHMNNLNLPADLQKRVRLWLSHTWEQQKLNEGNILNLLPVKMKTDIAMNVHYKMLSKVQLFHGCERMVIRDLVVKLKPVLFLPGDYICKKGEIGQEMYIVNEGVVQVLGDAGNILASLSDGSVIGEVSVLGLPGCSRRMADVRSLGFSNLYVLSKADLWDTLRSYPEAQYILRQKAKRVMRERQGKSEALDDEVDADSIIKERPSTPRLLHTVMQIVAPESSCVKLLTRRHSQSTATGKSSVRASLTPTITHNTLSATSPMSLTSLECSSEDNEIHFIDNKNSVNVESEEESNVDPNVITEIMGNIMF